MGHEVFVAQPDLSSFIVQRDVVHAVKELIESVLVWKLSFPHRHTIDWDRPTLGTGPLLGQALGTGPLLGQARSWDRPTLGTGPLLGQALSWDRPILGTGALLGPLILLEHLAHLPLSNRHLSSNRMASFVIGTQRFTPRRAAACCRPGCMRSQLSAE